MNVLVFNPGSSSLKFEVIAAEEPAPHMVRGRKLLSGVIEPIGGPAKLFYFDGRKAIPQEDVPAPDHGRAAGLVLSRISSPVDLAACRVVHGGSCYADPVPVDDDVIAAIERLDELARCITPLRPQSCERFDAGWERRFRPSPYSIPGFTAPFRNMRGSMGSLGT